MKPLSKVIIVFAAAILSGILLYAIFPPLEISFFAWVALVPIFAVLTYTRYLQAFSMGFLMGMILAGFHIYWLNVIPGFPLIAFLAITFYSALYFGLFCLLFCLAIRKTRWPKFMIAPFLWVSIEYVRSNLSFLAIPWGLLGYSQYKNVAIIQIASFTSVYGISFVIVLVNTALTDALLWMTYSIRDKSERRFPYYIISAIVGSFSIVFCMYLWGSYQIKTFDNKNAGMLKVSLIQGNIPQNEKWESACKKNILERYSTLTKHASTEKPDLIIWPETATPGSLIGDPEITTSVRNLVQEIGIPLLLGSSTHSKTVLKRRKFRRDMNSAFLIDKEGVIISKYNKMRLLPFGEYIPFEGQIRWPRWLVPKSGEFIPGTFPTVFEFSKARFGVVICWESLFSDLFRKFVKKGSQFMVNLTNEAWFGKTAASSQIQSMSVFRAVENRVSLLRCANTGITSLIDPIGRIQAKVTDDLGNDLMVTGILTVSVPEPKKPTFYTRNGDIFAIACSIGAGLFMVSALFPAKPIDIKRL